MATRRLREAEYTELTEKARVHDQYLRATIRMRDMTTSMVENAEIPEAYRAGWKACLRTWRDVLLAEMTDA